MAFSLVELTYDVVCMSDEEGFARDVYERLYALLEKQKQFKEGKNLGIERDFVRLAENNQIYIDKGALVPDGMVRWALEKVLKSDPA